MLLPSWVSPGYGDKKKQEKEKGKAMITQASNTPDETSVTTDLSSRCQQLISLLSQQLTQATP